MTRSRPGRQRSRGAIDQLQSGALRVRVYAGTDPVTSRRRDLVEVIPPGPKAARLAEAARTRLLSQVDEQRQPRTNSTVNQLLDQHFKMSTWERSTCETYAGYAAKHIRPLLGHVQVGDLNARTFDSSTPSCAAAATTAAASGTSTTGPRTRTSATSAAGCTSVSRSGRRRSDRSTSSSAAR